jgi:hypothetical protein
MIVNPLRMILQTLQTDEFREESAEKLKLQIKSIWEKL